MKIVLSSRGSRGNVTPVIEIASELKSRGHNVTLCVPDFFDEQARIKGIQPVLYKEDSEQIMKNMGSGWKHAANALYWFSQSINEQFDYMLSETKEADALVTSANELAAPTVAEYRNIPHYRIAGNPVLPGNQPPPLLPLQGLPDFANRIFWKLLNDSAGLFIRRLLDKKRKELHLQPIGSIADYFTQNSRTLLIINKELSPECPSWKSRYRYRYTGYCYRNMNGRLNPEVKSFIQSGEKPVYIGLGSVSIKNPDRFTDIVYKASLKSGTRIILEEGWAGLGNGRRNENILIVRDTPHSLLFPFMSAIIHHGGCGTTHTAARAGIPQLVLPQIADQYYWAHRVSKLGLGPDPFNPNKITADKLTSILIDLKHNKNYRLNADSLAIMMKDEDGSSEAADAIEKWKIREKKPTHADL